MWMFQVSKCFLKWFAFLHIKKKKLPLSHSLFGPFCECHSTSLSDYYRLSRQSGGICCFFFSFSFGWLSKSPLGIVLQIKICTDKICKQPTWPCGSVMQWMMLYIREIMWCSQLQLRLGRGAQVSLKRRRWLLDCNCETWLGRSGESLSFTEPNNIPPFINHLRPCDLNKLLSFLSVVAALTMWNSYSSVLGAKTCNGKTQRQYIYFLSSTVSVTDGWRESCVLQQIHSSSAGVGVGVHRWQVFNVKSTFFLSCLCLCSSGCAVKCVGS